MTRAAFWLLSNGRATFNADVQTSDADDVWLVRGLGLKDNNGLELYGIPQLDGPNTSKIIALLFCIKRRCFAPHTSFRISKELPCITIVKSSSEASGCRNAHSSKLAALHEGDGQSCPELSIQWSSSCQHGARLGDRAVVRKRDSRRGRPAKWSLPERQTRIFTQPLNKIHRAGSPMFTSRRLHRPREGTKRVSSRRLGADRDSRDSDVLLCVMCHRTPLALPDGLGANPSGPDDAHLQVLGRWPHDAEGAEGLCTVLCWLVARQSLSYVASSTPPTALRACRRSASQLEIVLISGSPRRSRSSVCLTSCGGEVTARRRRLRDRQCRR